MGTSLGVIILVQTVFQITQDTGYCEGQDKVDNSDDEEGLEILVGLGGHGITREVKLDNGDNIEDWGILDVDDEFVPCSW